MIEKVPSTLDKAGKRDVRHLVFRIIEPLQELLLHAGEAYESIQWKMTHQPRLCVKTADNCNKSK